MYINTIFSQISFINFQDEKIAIEEEAIRFINTLPIIYIQDTFRISQVWREGFYSFSETINTSEFKEVVSRLKNTDIDGDIGEIYAYKVKGNFNIEFPEYRSFILYIEDVEYINKVKAYQEYSLILVNYNLTNRYITSVVELANWWNDGYVAGISYTFYNSFDYINMASELHHLDMGNEVDKTTYKVNLIIDKNGFVKSVKE